MSSIDDQIAIDQVECMNMDDESNVRSLFSETAAGSVVSDIDPQLLLSVPFKVPVKLSGIRFTYSDSSDKQRVPETIKLFANRVSIGFSDAEALPALQTLSYSEIISGEKIPLKVALFQNITSLQLFVDTNQGGVDTSELGKIKLFGSLAETMNMREFKKIKDDE
jgi:hypothetical protein